LPTQFRSRPNHTMEVTMETVMPNREIESARSQGAEGHPDRKSGSLALAIRFKGGPLGQSAF
jgi:hypothetical protein